MKKLLKPKHFLLSYAFMSLWCAAPFEFLYNAILDASRERQLEVLRTLTAGALLKLVEKPKKCDASRQAVETGKVTFTDGMEYQLNKIFVDDAIRTANVLDLDEKVAAEVLFYALNSDVNIGVNPIETAVISWYDRNTFIFQILSYYLNVSDDLQSGSPQQYVFDLIREKPKFSQDIVSSMKLIGAELDEIKKEIDRAKVLGEYVPENPQMKNISYRRDVLYKQHQLLGEILHGYVVTFMDKISFEDIKSILDHVQTFDPCDQFALSYFPALMAYVTSLDKIGDAKVEAIHKEFISTVSNIEKLAESPFKSMIILAFLTAFISWCKGSTTRSAKYEFQSSVESPMEKVIAIGALEQFLTICADTSEIEITDDGKPYYNFRGFLQRHIPSYIPLRCMDIDEKATSKQKLLTSTAQSQDVKPVYVSGQSLKPTTHFIEFIITSLHNFVFDFASNAAFMLTSLRDQEEDLLLSEENDIEGVAENADLERAYLGMFYLYSKRPELGASFWANAESNYSSNVLYGFLQWGSKCNSPLIMASYSMLLSALSSNEGNAESVFSFLQSTNSDSIQMGGSSGSIRGMRDTNGLLLKYGSVSWSTIYSSLAYYNTQLKNISGSVPQQASFTIDKKADTNTEFKPVVAELGEDSVIYLSALFHILLSVSKQSPKARKELLESDDGQLIGLLQVLLVNVSENVIKGAVMNVLSSLIGPDSLYEVSMITSEVNNKFEKDTREKIWKALDSWLFQNSANGIPKDRLMKELTSYPLISGFTNLISSLLSAYPGSDNTLEPSGANFPASTSNPSFVAVYVEFLITEVFPSIEYSTDSIVSELERKSLQLAILRLIAKLLKSLNPQFIEICQAAGLKEIDKVISIKGGIVGFLQSHPGSAALKSLYQNSVYEAIFRIGNVGVDSLNQFAPHSIELELLQESISVVEMILERDTFYVNDLVPVLRLKDNQYMDPAAVGSGTSGLRNFYDAFLLNLQFVSNISLYVSSSHSTIAKKALSIFKYICGSKLFDASNVYGTNALSGSNKGKMLIVLETSDESHRVRESWIQQYESSVNYEDEDAGVSIGAKISMLEFLVGELRKSEPSQGLASWNVTPTVAHFLLGFDTKKCNLGSDEDFGSVRSQRSLLRSIVISLSDAIVTLNASSVEHSHIRIAYMCMKIVLILCKSKTFGHEILEWLREENEVDIIQQFLKNSKFVNTMTMWAGQRFNENVSVESEFSAKGDSISTLTFFVNFRSTFFELLTETLNDSLEFGNMGLIGRYVQLLTSSTGYGTDLNKILEFLDVTSFHTKATMGKVDGVFSKFDFGYILSQTRLGSEQREGSYYDVRVIDELVRVLAREHPWGVGKSVREGMGMLMEGKERLKRLVVCSMTNDELRWSYLEYLKSWSRLTECVAHYGFGQEDSRRTNFILEVFQSIVPRIEEYLERGGTYAEILVGLCVHLVGVYVGEKEGEAEARSQIDSRRLFPLFQTCIRGILQPASETMLRADLYVLGGEYLRTTMVNGGVIVSSELLVFMRSVDPRFYETVFNDSLGGGATQEGALVFLRTLLVCLLRVGEGEVCEQFVSDTVCGSEYVWRVVERLRGVEEDVVCGGRGSEQGERALAQYRLLASVLRVVAQSRVGAQRLVQARVFSLVRESRVTEGGTSEEAVELLRLATTVVITMGSRNHETRAEAAKTAAHFAGAMERVFQRDSLAQEKPGTVGAQEAARVGQLTDLYALLSALAQ